MHDPRTEAAARQHLDLMRLAEFAETTVYARYRCLVRMDAWFARCLLDLGEDDLHEWRMSMTGTPATVAHYVSHAHSFFDWAVDYRLMAANPAARLPIPKRGRRLPRPISEHDLEFAIRMASERIRPWLVLAGWCGLRAKEIALLQRENILDTSRPPLVIVASNATKGHHERAVPLCEYAVAELAKARLPSSGYAFRRRDGALGPNAPWTVSELCNEHLHACGIAATLHQLRHRFLSECYRISRDLRQCQELAGHADPATTAGYAAINPSEAVGIVEQLGTPRRLVSVEGGQ